MYNGIVWVCICICTGIIVPYIGTSVFTYMHGFTMFLTPIPALTYVNSSTCIHILTSISVDLVGRVESPQRPLQSSI